MDKTGFLKELKQYLAVLNEGEQKDILDEYAQHIDMKMERGMSESEAIRDFGNMEELASEILEAYHVNPQYGAKKHTRFAIKEEIPVAELADSGRKFWSKAVGFLKKLGRKAAAAFSGMRQVLKKPFLRLLEGWNHRKDSDKQRADFRKKRPSVEVARIRRKKMFGEVPGMAASGVRTIFMMIVNLAAWCVRWGWNLLMLLIACMTAFTMLGSLYGLGVLLVLLHQGYPLRGLVLGSLGMVLCTGALLATALCLCRFHAENTGIKKTGRLAADTDEAEYEEPCSEEQFAEEDPEHAS